MSDNAHRHYLSELQKKDGEIERLRALLKRVEFDSTCSYCEAVECSICRNCKHEIKRPSHAPGCEIKRELEG